MQVNPETKSGYSPRHFSKFHVTFSVSEAEETSRYSVMQIGLPVGEPERIPVMVFEVEWASPCEFSSSSVNDLDSVEGPELSDL